MNSIKAVSSLKAKTLENPIFLQIPNKTKQIKCLKPKISELFFSIKMALRRIQSFAIFVFYTLDLECLPKGPESFIPSLTLSEGGENFSRWGVVGGFRLLGLYP
jgi:hypothetical protein